jgi:hypothetical protein
MQEKKSPFVQFAITLRISIPKESNICAGPTYAVLYRPSAYEFTVRNRGPPVHVHGKEISAKTG